MQVHNSSAADELRALLLEEIEANQSADGWGGTGIVVRFNQFSLTADLKARVNHIGMIHGCHTCLTRVELDRDQPWIGDHFPPTELAFHARAALANLLGDNSFLNTAQILLPQCHECSSRQAALVRKLNSMKRSEIERWLQTDEDDLLDVQMLTSGVSELKRGRTYIRSSGPKVTANEGWQIQQIGQLHGCHSDPSHATPCSIYHADHTWPQEFCTHYMTEVMRYLGLEDKIPAQQELRPQCPKCSGNQGGKLSNISKKALAFAQAMGIQFYK